MTDTAGSLTENLIDLIEAVGGSRPASKGLSELYQYLADALSTGGPGAGVSSVTNADGSITISPTTGNVVASISRTLTGLYTLEIPTTTLGQDGGLAFKFSSISALGNAISFYDYLDEPIAALGVDGGWKVFGDAIQVASGGNIFGPFTGLDGTTNPPSVKWSGGPGSAYNSGFRLWSGPGLPTDSTIGVTVGIASLNDLWWDTGSGAFYICVSPGTPGTWIPYAIGTAGVTSFSGRTGAVVPTTGDYTAQQVSAAPIVQIPAIFYGADPTGAADSTAAINAAKQAGGAASIVSLGIGNFKVGTETTTTSTTSSNIVTTCPATFTFASTAGMYNGPSTFAVAVSSGVAIIGYTAISGLTATGCFYITGGTGTLSASATVTLEIGNFGRNKGIQGAGQSLCSITYHGYGACIRQEDFTFSASASFAAPCGGINILGTGNTNPNAVGWYTGNLTKQRNHDIQTYGFTGTSAVGTWLNNSGGGIGEQSSWTSCISSANTNQVIISGASWDYCDFDFLITAQANQNGLVMQSAQGIGSHLRIKGNFFTGNGSNSGVAWTFGVSNSDTSSWLGTYDIQVEVDQTSTYTTAHKSLQIQTAGGSDGIFGQGTISFAADGSIVFGSATGTSGANGSFGVSGYLNIPGFGTMSNTGDALGVGGGSLWLVRGGPTAVFSGNLYLQSGDIQMCQIASGSNTFTFQQAPSDTNFFGKKFTFFIVQPASGARGTATWPGNVVWLSGSAPILSAANSAVDMVEMVYFPVNNTWYAWYAADSAINLASRCAFITSNTATPALDTDNFSALEISGQSANITGFTMTGTPQANATLRISFQTTGSITIAYGSSFEASTTVALLASITGAARVDTYYVWNPATSKWRAQGSS